MAIDREKLKDATGGRGGGGKGKATSLASVGGPAPTLVLKGREFAVLPLSFNDLLEAERRYGALDTFIAALYGGHLEAVRFVVWRVLRKAEPDLTEEQTGELLPVRLPELEAMLEVMLPAFGLVDEEPAAAGNAASSPTGN